MGALRQPKRDRSQDLTLQRVLARIMQTLASNNPVSSVQPETPASASAGPRHDHRFQNHAEEKYSRENYNIQFRRDNIVIDDSDRD